MAVSDRIIVMNAGASSSRACRANSMSGPPRRFSARFMGESIPRAGSSAASTRPGEGAAGAKPRSRSPNTGAADGEAHGRGASGGHHGRTLAGFGRRARRQDRQSELSRHAHEYFHRHGGRHAVRHLPPGRASPGGGEQASPSGWPPEASSSSANDNRKWNRAGPGAPQPRADRYGGVASRRPASVSLHTSQSGFSGLLNHGCARRARGSGATMAATTAWPSRSNAATCLRPVRGLGANRALWGVEDRLSNSLSFNANTQMNASHGAQWCDQRTRRRPL